MLVSNNQRQGEMVYFHLHPESAGTFCRGILMCHAFQPVKQRIIYDIQLFPGKPKSPIYLSLHKGQSLFSGFISITAKMWDASSRWGTTSCTTHFTIPTDTHWINLLKRMLIQFPEVKFHHTISNAGLHSAWHKSGIKKIQLKKKKR